MVATNEDNLHPDVLLKDAAEMFQSFTEKLNTEIIRYADSTVNAEIRITNAFVAYCQACVDHGFGQTLLEKMKGISDAGLDVNAALMEELIGQVDVYKVESDQKALAFIRVLRAEGFTTADINDFGDDIKKAGNHARLYGATQAIKTTSKD